MIYTSAVVSFRVLLLKPGQGTAIGSVIIIAVLIERLLSGARRRA